MDWIGAASIIVWLVLGTFSLGASDWLEGISRNDWGEIIFAYVIWLIVYPFVLIYKLGVYARNLG